MESFTKNLDNSKPLFPQIEEQVLSFWRDENVFEKSVTQNEGAEPFVVYDGPPTANAKPALHHTLPGSFKDAAGRYMTMRGRYVPRQSGWDTHGLPVEVQVEKALGLTGKKEILNLVEGDEKASIKKFNEICRESVWEFKQDWDKFLPRFGYWLDQENPYITYEPSYIEGVWSVMKQVWDAGHMFKDYKVLPYCPRCGTGLSAAEVAQGYQDVKDVSVYVTFPIVEKPGVSFLAWTTTPWTLPGNVALAVGSEIEYVEVLQHGEAGETRLILAKSRLSVLSSDYEITAEYTGLDLVGLTYAPLYAEPLANVEGKKYLVVPAGFVTTEDGSGIVHTAVMYGEDDFNLGKAEGLARVHTVDLSGHFNELVPEFTGMFVRDALVPILRDLTAKSRLYKKETITHSYPHCWRCKTPLIYYAKDSWYIGMSKLRQELMDSNNDVTWIPDHVKEGRFGDFIREARDWAISRERFWGTPLPVWVAPSGAMLCVGSFEELRALAKDPSQVPPDFDPHRPFIDDVVLVKDGEEYVREPYVLDVWIDSGSMPYASGRKEQGLFPADYIAEGVDQTRGWFYSMLALGTLTQGMSAYKRVVCFGHLVDEQGKKMSKSIGNIIKPEDIFNEYGADALRWYLFTLNAPGETKSFSTKDLQTAYRNTHMLLMNIVSFYKTGAELNGFSVPYADERMAARKNAKKNVDKWILSRQAQTVTEVTAYLDAFDYLRAGRTIAAFVNDLSTWYLRLSRKRTDNLFFTILYDTAMHAIAMLAPMTPFLTEHLFNELRHESDPVSIHLAKWPEQPFGANSELEKEMARLRLAVELGLSVRSQHKIKVRQPLAEAVVSAAVPFSDELVELLMDELNVLSVRQGAPTENLAMSREEQGIAVSLDLEITEQLALAGRAREFQRVVQNLRKQLGCQPGQWMQLLVAPQHRSVVEELLTAQPGIVQDAYLVVNDQTWESLPETEIELEGETLLVGLQPKA
ncbi:MAG TPA: isoleucine--tRNA ligase [Verrucomicrobiae bacterium]|nr:isoleucine--tRNA ligase [Verrucomicrobiae bacterium]